jgi:hypothetical protein
VVDQLAGDIGRKVDPVAALMERVILIAGQTNRSEKLHRHRRVGPLDRPRQLKEPASTGLIGIEAVHRVSSIVSLRSRSREVHRYRGKAAALPGPRATKAQPAA